MTEQPTDYPPFAEALDRFRTFAREQAVPDDVTFIESGDVVFRGRDVHIRRIDPVITQARAVVQYESAVARRHGVLLSGLCVLDDRLCTYVYGPRDAEEASSLMFPDGLKLSVHQPLLRGVPAGAVHWLILRAKETLTHQAVSKDEVFT
jgi:hypothetical protein